MLENDITPSYILQYIRGITPAADDLVGGGGGALPPGRGSDTRRRSEVVASFPASVKASEADPGGGNGIRLFFYFYESICGSGGAYRYN